MAFVAPALEEESEEEVDADAEESEPVPPESLDESVLLPAPEPERVLRPEALPPRESVRESLL